MAARTVKYVVRYQSTDDVTVQEQEHDTQESADRAAQELKQTGKTWVLSPCARRVMEREEQ